MELRQLIRECKKNSVTAQKWLYDRFAVQFFVLCRRYQKTDAEAEETLQNGFLKVFQHMPEFVYNSDGAFVSWMKKIMVNECLQELRKKNNFFLVPETEAAEIGSCNDAIDRLSTQEIFRLITQMPVGYRTVLNLFAIEGYSHIEIAAMLNISVNTSKSQLSKARKTLQELVEKKYNYEERKAK
jgi:RNA polymerase sigma factor (sigma-70 family)